MAKNKYLLLTGIFILLLIAILDLIFELEVYFIETFLFIILLLFFYKTYNTFKLNSILFILIIISFALHLAGSFGFYAKSPLPVNWDNITHFFPTMTFTMVSFSFLSNYMDNKFTLKTFLLILFAFLSGLGIGAIIENTEFLGFSILGYGEGGLKFGPGDAFQNNFSSEVILSKIETSVGGWFNTMHDLLFNLAGALTGIILMSIKRAYQKY